MRSARCCASMGPRSWDRGEAALNAACGRKSFASMGPRSWDRGEALSARVTRWPRGCFNGAAVLGPRRDPRQRLYWVAHSSLQWGRGLGTAESLLGEPVEFAPLGFNGAAVLGPRRARRAVDVLDVETALQCGRGLGTAESTRWMPTPPLRQSRQWGRGVGAAERALMKG